MFSKLKVKVWKRVMGFRRRTRLCRNKLGKRKKTDPAKVFSRFSKSNYQPLSGTERKIFALFPFPNLFLAFIFLQRKKINALQV